jgi:hypothetical protein
VKRYDKYGRKVSWKVKRYGKYRRKESENSEIDMENTQEKEVE